MKLAVTSLFGYLIACANAQLKCCVRIANASCNPERACLQILLALFVGFLTGVSIRFSFPQGSLNHTSLLEINQNYCNCQLSYSEINDTKKNLSLVVRDYRNDSFEANQQLKQKKQVRICCLILTLPNYHELKARHVKNTWAKRCNKYVFASSKNDASLPAINLGVKEGPKFLWAKTKAAFTYAFKHYVNDCDFYLRADDDSYVVVENLRYMLRDANPNEPLYIGRRIRAHVKQGFMSGGAGYVLSREAVRRFVQKAITSKNACRKDSKGSEDVNISICLEIVGVKIMDSRDELGRERFHPHPPDLHLDPNGFGKKHWLRKSNYYPLKLGAECCSNTTVSFHYVSPGQIRAIHFLIYRMQLQAIASANVWSNRTDVSGIN